MKNSKFLMTKAGSLHTGTQGQTPGLHCPFRILITGKVNKSREFNKNKNNRSPSKDCKSVHDMNLDPKYTLCPPRHYPIQNHRSQLGTDGMDPGWPRAQEQGEHGSIKQGKPRLPGRAGTYSKMQSPTYSLMTIKRKGTWDRGWTTLRRGGSS